jgi:hypothetical protein
MILLITAIGSAHGQVPTLPALPQQTVNLTLPTQGTSTCPTLTTGTNCIRNVPAGDATSLQKAINAATCGDTIVLAKGSTYIGNFTIPSTFCSGWIEIQSSAMGSLPAPGNRVGPSNVSNMATISTPNTYAALAFLPSSNHWRLMGLEITTSYVSTTNTVFGLVTAGLQSDGSTVVSVVAQLPAYLIFDRIYIHGLSTTNTKRAIEMDTQSIGIVDSYCDEIHYNQNDSQCFASWNGVGPFLIQNNFIQAGAEDIMFGGADPAIANLIPSDITVVGNIMQKNLTWRNESAPYNWVIKNIFELKSAQRVLIDGNVLQYIWLAGQTGFAIMLTPRSGGACAWCTVQDVTITHNLIRHVADGIEISGENPGYPNLPTLPSARILVQNNVLDDVSSINWGGHGWVYEIAMESNELPPHDIIIDHNTSFPDTTNGAVYVLGNSGVAPNFQITNLLSVYGAYGIFGSGAGSGIPALSTYLTGYIYDKNAFITSSGTSQGKYPSGTLWNTQTGVKFTDFASTNYQLLSISPYHNAGTDGKDIGMWDWTCLNNDSAAALAGKFIPGSGCALSADLPLQPPSDLKAVVD